MSQLSGGQKALVALSIIYAGAVEKTIATSTSIVLTALVEQAIGRTPPSVFAVMHCVHVAGLVIVYALSRDASGRFVGASAPKAPYPSLLRDLDDD